MKALVSITPTLLPDLYHTDQLRRALGFVRPAVTRAISQASKTQLSCFLCGIKTCITGPGALGSQRAFSDIRFQESV